MGNQVFLLSLAVGEKIMVNILELMKQPIIGRLQKTKKDLHGI